MATAIPLNSTPPLEISWDIYRGDTVGLRLAFHSAGQPADPAAMATLKASTWRLSFKNAGTVEAHSWDGDTLVITVPSTLTAKLTRPLKGDIQQNTGQGVITFATITGTLSSDVSPTGAIAAEEVAVRYHEIAVDTVTGSIAGQATVYVGGQGVPGVGVASAQLDGQQLTFTLSNGQQLPPLTLPGLSDQEASELRDLVSTLNAAVNAAASKDALTALSNQLTNVYTKAEVGNLLGGKANAQTVASLTAEHNALEARVDVLGGDLVAGLNLKANNEDVTALGQRTGHVEDRAGVLEDDVTALKAQVDALESGEGPDLSTYATKAELDARVAALIDASPEFFDTIGEAYAHWSAQSDLIVALQSRTAKSETDITALQTQTGNIETALATKADQGTLSSLTTSVTANTTELTRVAGLTDGHEALIGAVITSPGGNNTIGAQLVELHAGKADKTQLAGYVTSTAAAATYATQAALSDVSGQIVAASPASTLLPLSKPESVVTTFQAGHGFAFQTGTVGTQADDAADFAVGTQGLRITSDGVGGVSATRKTGLNVNLSSKLVKVAVKVDEPTRISDLILYVSSDNMATSASARLYPSTVPSVAWLQPGEWTVITLSPGEFTNLAAVNLAAVNTLQLRVKDRGTGAVVVRFGGVWTSALPARGTVSFTFDDGWDSQYMLGRAALDAARYPATAYLISDRIGTPGYMSLAQVKALKTVSGWELGAHAHTSAVHDARFTNVTVEALDADIRAQKAWFRANGLSAPEHLAYPGGALNPGVEQVMRAHYATARSIYSVQRESLPPAVPTRLRAWSLTNTDTLANVQAAVDRAAANGEWLILAFHKLVEGATSASTEWNAADFRALVAYVGTKAVDVRTVGEALRAADLSTATGNVSGPATSTTRGLPMFSDATGKVLAAAPLEVGAYGEVRTTGTGYAGVAPNARGAGSVDLQVKRTNASQVASGELSTIAGGSSNTASGTQSSIGGGDSNTASGAQSSVGGGLSNTASGAQSTIAGGQSNTASGVHSSVTGGHFNWATGNYGRAGGRYTNARRYGQDSYGAFSIGQVGDAQTTRLNLGITTTTATPTELTLDRAAPSALGRFTFAGGQVMAFAIYVIAQTANATEAAAWKIEGVARNAGATNTLEILPNPGPTVTLLGASAGATGWSVSVAADNTNKAVRILGTGAAGVTISWFAGVGGPEQIY